MNLRFSAHKSKHTNEKWNQETIKEVMDNHQVTGLHFRMGDTTDVMYGYAPDGECVGLILSKRTGTGERVIITGFAAPEDYWKNV